MKLPRERAGQSRADKTCWEGEWRWLLHLKSTLPTFYPPIIFNIAPRITAQRCNRGSRSDGSFELEPSWWHKTVESIQAGENINLEVWITFFVSSISIKNEKSFHQKQDHLKDECSAGDQTIILGLQIFLDHRSSRTIDQKLWWPTPTPLAPSCPLLFE